MVSGTTDGTFVVRPARDVADGEAGSEAGKVVAWMWMRTSALQMVGAIPGCGEQRRGMASTLSEAKRCEKGYGGVVEGVGEGEALARGFIAQRLGLHSGTPASVPLI